MEITPQELLNRIQELSVLIKLYEDNGIEWSRAKNKYQLGLATKILELDVSGKAKTLILELARGDEKIAQLRFQKDAKNIILESSKEKIYAIKKEIGVLETILKLEWAQAGKGI